MKDEAFIEHMIDAVSRIERYTRNMDYEDFDDDELHQDAVIRQIEILGEAAKRVSEEMKDRYPKVPWKDAASMRDKLIHGYFGVDTRIVWNTVQNDIPNLKQKFLNIKNEEF